MAAAQKLEKLQFWSQYKHIFHENRKIIGKSLKIIKKSYKTKQKIENNTAPPSAAPQGGGREVVFNFLLGFCMSFEWFSMIFLWFSCFHGKYACIAKRTVRFLFSSLHTWLTYTPPAHQKKLTKIIENCRFDPNHVHKGIMGPRKVGSKSHQWI